MLPTIADVLALDSVRRGNPRVVAGADRLGTPVRWVHVGEVTDIAHLLRGGELVLTTGIALPDDPGKLAEYIAELSSVGVSGLIVELGRKFIGELPHAVVRSAEEHGLPLIMLARETPFVQITESVHARIIDIQLEELRASEQLHEVFTELSVEGASPAEVLSQVARLSGPTGAAGEPRPPGAGLRDRRTRHRQAAGRLGDPIPRRGTRPSAPPTTPTSGWLVTTVGARGQDWGRLILLCDTEPGPPRHRARRARGDHPCPGPPVGAPPGVHSNARPTARSSPAS